MNTYWLIHQRRFQNEYTVGVATTAESADQYRDEGYTRINRDFALRLLSKRAASHEQLFSSASIDGEEPWSSGYYDTSELARAIRTGRPL